MANYCIWIVSPPKYLHSQGAEEIAIALRSGLLAHGIDAPIKRQAWPPKEIPIILFPQLLSLCPQPIELHPRSIIYNLEQIQQGSVWLTENYVNILRNYNVWDYSFSNIEALKQLNVHNVDYVGIGYAPELTRIKAAEEDLDVLFIGSMNERRKEILESINQNGVQIATAFNMYGQQRDEAFARARIIVNIHYYEAKVFEIVRVSYLLANTRFVVSEKGSDALIEAQYSDGLVFCTAQEMPQVCFEYVQNEKARKAIAQKGFDIFSQLTQAHYLAPVINQLK